MIAQVPPGRISGSLGAIASKSQAHRLLIAAALSDRPTRILCGESSEDIDSTLRCLGALGAKVETGHGVITLTPGHAPANATLPVGESGASYRFLLPVAGALGVSARFQLKGRLPERPMAPLFQALASHGLSIAGEGSAEVQVAGRLHSGLFELPGDVSSQFITGLMLAAPLTGGDCEIRLTSPLESRSYVGMTAEAMKRFGIGLSLGEECILIPGGQAYSSPGELGVEGDWSNAALWLCAAAAGRGELALSGLDLASSQGDRAVLSMLRRFGADIRSEGGGLVVRPAPLQGCELDIRDTPDLAPALALPAMAATGDTRLSGIGRLRLKESDRAQSIRQTVRSLGGWADIEGDSLVIRGNAPLQGGICDGHGDHRIVMLAAAAAALCAGPVTIRGAQAVRKSYPAFFDDLRALGLHPALREEA